MAGDFFQLAPVVRSPDIVRYAFEAELWGSVLKHQLQLTKVFRQRDPGAAVVPWHLKQSSLDVQNSSGCSTRSALAAHLRRL